MSAVDYNSFLMQQSKRQRELKMRRREAEQLLHGFRGFYGESFTSWSPRHAKNERNSGGGHFGFGAEDALGDPNDDDSRRDSQSFCGDYESRDDNTPRRYSERFKPNPLDPHAADFLLDGRHYDGTKYTRTQQEMEVQNGVVMFSPRADQQSSNHFRERPPLSARSSASRRKPSFGEASNFGDASTGDFPVDFEENEFREGPPSTTKSSSSGQKSFFKSPAGASDEATLERIRNRFSTSPYEAPRMKLYTPKSASSQDFERILEGVPQEEFNQNVAQISGQTCEDREVQQSATSSSHARTPTNNNGNNSKIIDLTSDESEDRGSEMLVSPHAERRRSHDPTGVSGADLTNDSFDGSTQNGEQRSSEDPSGREPAIYRERRIQLQVNTKPQEDVDGTSTKDRLQQAHEEARSWPIEHRELLNAPSEDSTVLSPSRRAAENRSKIVKEELPQEEKKEPVPKAPVRETIWRDFVSDEPGAKFPPEAGRYHLYASYACPGSHRALIVRALKGLEDVISVTIVHPTWRHTNPDNPKDKHRGWIFGNPDGKPFHNTMGRGGPFPPAYPGNDPDPVLNAFSVRNIYEYAEDTSGKYTIPLLWDTKLNTIVNNESSDISYMLNSSFNKFAAKPELDLYTEDDDDALDRLNEVSQWLYPMMIHGVYRCGFAKTQRAYDIAIEELTAAFDAADDLLQHQRYLTGDTLTDADIRFFVTLLRFDEVYAFYFRANTRLVLMTPSLLNFCREIYQMPGVAETCQMDQIKAHFFGSHAEWNKYSVVPRGLDFMRYLEMPHDRDSVASFGLI